METNKLNEELHSAVRLGDYNKVVRLINQGADSNYKDSFKSDALFYAVAHYQDNISKFLIENGSDLNTLYKDNQNILHIAIRCEYEDKGKFDIVKLLVDKGVKINVQDKYGNTPLWYACGYYAINETTIKFLLQNGADMHLNNKYGVNCYRSAEKLERKELLSILDKYNMNNI